MPLTVSYVADEYNVLIPSAPSCILSMRLLRVQVPP